ncbi:hypothetical protein HNP52_003492 [Sphingomonas kyeonggiensis]|uniref:Uncharacterized protein n=1 Tax=Sphingomonas kyeonggiensis TaxID=1268553 RepID=A0A7W7K4V1_9SPHN|nr:hypothetical protein [Sphingomonas kyeonggiensis]MBB4840400.1 hypothetical protein [Sphingomonas kyeonggiensis]
MLLAAIVLQASAASFSPPLDRALLVVTERHDDTRLYRMERRIRFAREDGGYRAEVVLAEAEGETSDSSGALFEAGYAALAGTPLIFHLDKAGTVTAIDDLPALWERFCRRVAEVAAARRALAPAERPKFAERVAAPIRALPDGRRRAMLASLVLAVVPDEPLVPGTGPVRLPGSSAYGSARPLEGMRSVTASPGGLLRSTTVASGENVTLERITEVDPHTGLITRNSKTLRIRTGGLEKISRTQLTVEPLAD